jgi:hypothetical protein
MAIVGTGPLGFSANPRHRLEASAPKGLEDSAQGFNPGNQPPRATQRVRTRDKPRPPRCRAVVNSTDLPV